MWGERKIRNCRKPDLRGRKDANDMIIKNTHKIILDMIFIIDDETISDIIRNKEHTNHAGYYFYLSESDGACRMDEERVFSLSYEQLTRFAEQRIRECNLDSQGVIYLCESARAGAVLIFWHELAINGYASMNAIKRQELIDADFQRLRKLIWPEDDR